MNSDYITKKEYMQNNSIIATSFEKLITEFRSEMKSIHSRLDDHDRRLKSVEKDVGVMKKDISQIKDSLIDLTFEMRSMREELAAVTYRNIELADTTDAHGVRITSIEEKLTA